MSLKLLKQSIQISLARMQANKIKQNEEIGNDAYEPKVEIIPKKKKYNDSQKKRAANLRRRLREIRKSKGKKEKNVKSLLKISNSSEIIEDAQKIVQYVDNGRYVNKPTPAVNTESIFTDEDFKAFEEEYIKSLK